MGRRMGAFALLVCLAGCATTSQQASHHAPPTVQYLDGIETQFARRLDSISNDEVLPEDSVMRDAVIAGDADLWIAATVFRRGDFYTLDLIVLNRGQEPVQIAREDLRLVDGDGRWLSDVSDWEGAQRLGLRGKSHRAAPRFVHDAPVPAPPVSSSIDTPLPGTKGRSTSSRTGPVPAPYDQDVAWRAEFEPVAPGVPRELEVDAATGKAFWAYWSAEDEVKFPLTAFVMLEDRHMMFQFDN